MSPWLPAVITLALIATLRLGVPYYDSWWFVDEFIRWQQGDYSWRDLLATHGPHPSVPGKLIYWFAMSVMSGDVSWLPFVAWLLSLVVALSVRALVRQRFAAENVRLTLLFLANSFIFTTAQSGSWLWDFVFQNYFVGACLLASQSLVLRRQSQTWHLVAAWLLACLGALSFGSGFIIAWLLLPALWFRSRSHLRSQVVGAMVGGVLLALFLTWFSMAYMPSLGHSSQHAQTSERVESLLGRPAMTLKYLLIVVGGSLGHGSSLDPEDQSLVAGAVVVIVFGACLWMLWKRRKVEGLLADAWPWLACCLFALANTGMIALARMSKSYSTALAPRYVTFTLLFMVGVTMLVALMLQNQAERQRSWTLSAVLVLMALQSANWIYGAQAMRHFHYVLRQNRAALHFAKVLPLSPDRVIEYQGPGSVERMAIKLHEQGRLRGVQMVSDTKLSNLRVMSEMSVNSARVDLVVRRPDGKIVMNGTCEGGAQLGMLPDLILITASESNADERVIAFQFPNLPTDYFADGQRRREHREHYLGWQVVLDQAPVPQTAGTRLRAYAFNGETLRARRIQGEHPVPPP